MGAGACCRPEEGACCRRGVLLQAGGPAAGRGAPRGPAPSPPANPAHPALPTQELYQLPGNSKSVNIGHIKTHYFTSHPHLNTYGIIPAGGPAWWEEPHDRDAKFPLAAGKSQ